MFIPISFLTISSTEESFVVFFLFIFYHRPSSFYPPSSHFLFLSDPHSLAISICLSIHPFFFLYKAKLQLNCNCSCDEIEKIQNLPQKKTKNTKVFFLSLCSSFEEKLIFYSVWCGLWTLLFFLQISFTL